MKLDSWSGGEVEMQRGKELARPSVSALFFVRSVGERHVDLETHALWSLLHFEVTACLTLYILRFQISEYESAIKKKRLEKRNLDSQEVSGGYD